jgi:heme a synthase
MDPTPLVDWTPIARLALIGLLLAAGPLAWLWWKHRAAEPAVRLRVLTFITLFLTFDLVVFGSFTRLTDSGLGCPDWPGCYGSASPLGARDAIHAAQTALPTGPVTHGKAWIEMIHRYLATAVGVLITVLAISSWVVARRERGLPADRRSPMPLSPWWATASLVWVIAQGAFGALTVTMKLYPAIVTLHLLGGLGLLALLVVQAQAYVPQPLALAAPLRRALWLLGGLILMQVALGGWVSTNYAVLACTDFPTCQGRWWPPMDMAEGFAILRPLGESAAGGGYLPFEALTAIHMAHRLGALVLFLVLAGLVVALWRTGDADARRWAWAWIGLAVWQFVSGLSNVVLGWPLLAALAHSAGAAAMLTLVAVMLARVAQGRIASVSHRSGRATGSEVGLMPAGGGAFGAHAASRSGARSA